jgi:hypothetical protein
LKQLNANSSQAQQIGIGISHINMLGGFHPGPNDVKQNYMNVICLPVSFTSNHIIKHSSECFEVNFQNQEKKRKPEQHYVPWDILQTLHIIEKAKTQVQIGRLNLLIQQYSH